MREYGKTENLFVRDPDTHKLVVGELRDPANAQIGRWFVTEKVDGTNIRLIFKTDGTGYRCEVRGRSDNANLPPGLETMVAELTEDSADSIHYWFGELTGGDPDIVVCVYGEGYGPGIQKVGGNYRPKEKGKSIRLFDVTTTRIVDGSPVGTWWRDWAAVEAAAEATGLKTVPVLAREEALADIVEVVRLPFASTVAVEDGGVSGTLAEGVVARTDPYLYDFRGRRVMFKLKTADLS